MAGAIIPSRGYYSVVRWMNDPGREEAKNLAVVLVTEDGKDGDIRTAPVRSVLQGDTRVKLVESMLADLKEKFAGEVKLTLEDLSKLHEGLSHSFQVTEPRRCAIVGTAADSLKPLYQSLVQPRAGGGGSLTSAGLSRSVAAQLNKWDFDARDNQEIEGYHFDVVATAPMGGITCLSTLSFATMARDWTPAERAAGHFLFALDKTSYPGAAVVNPPNDASSTAAWRCHEKVLSWYSREGIPSVNPVEVRERARVDWLMATATERLAS